MATDVEEYFGVIRALIAGRAPARANCPRQQSKSPSTTLDYLTNFERKFRIEGRAIFRAAYEKRPG